jgi:hypothetical protein
MLHAYLYPDRMWLLNLQVCYACYQLRFFHKKLSTMHACVNLQKSPPQPGCAASDLGVTNSSNPWFVRLPAPLHYLPVFSYIYAGQGMYHFSCILCFMRLPVCPCPIPAPVSVYSHKVVQIFLGTLASFIISTLKNHSHELVRYVSPWHLDSSEIRNHRQHYSTIWDSGYNIKICSSLAC